ncbi:MAG TPA: TOBE domain-containing protein, partial [Planctomycetota bacterium]|nr:TOBE domain-containing protein [Planctomycetota bacterium]
MKNVFEGTVESCDRKGSHAWVRLGDARVAVRLWPGIQEAEAVRLSVRPEDVVLCLGHPGRVSARNVLPGHVRSARYVPGGAEVEVDVGFRLVAALTRRAVKDLGLRRGRGVYALVKATAIVPELDVRTRFRVAPVGSKGRIDPPRIDFLRAVEREGSLSKAAKAVGITYRSAWGWARDVNRAWGRPLLEQTTGGKGGGGTVLTPE